MRVSLKCVGSVCPVLVNYHAGLRSHQFLSVSLFEGSDSCSLKLGPLTLQSTSSIADTEGTSS